MAYIGKEPIVGNFQKCDAITVVNGQAAYTLQVSSTNVTPESANHMLVSLNGILQAPVTSFTVSGSTLTFASNLATGDVIDFVILLGNVLDLGTVSDGTITAAKVANDLISGKTALASEPADTDEFLVSDAGTLKRIDYSLIKGGGSWVLVDTQTVSSTPTSIEPGAVFSATYDTYVIVIRRYNNVSGGGLHLQLGTSGGYTTSGYRWNGSGVGDGGGSLITGSSSDSVIDLLGGTSSSYACNSSQDCLSGVIWVHNPFNTARTSVHAEMAWENSADLKVHINNVGAHPGTDTQHDRWKLICPSGSQTFEATTIIQTFGVVNA